MNPGTPSKTAVKSPNRQPNASSHVGSPMGEYNKVILLGNLTRDPDLRYTPTGMPVCEFPIAVHHRHRLNDEVKEEVCYIDIVAFGKIGEHSKNFLRKGAQVLVDGRLSQRRWETAEGKPRNKYEVVVNTVQFLNKSSQNSAEPEKSAAE
jgi:single-strand DNA-binding protein